MSYKFAIIGGGLTATSMLCQLVDKLDLIGGGRPKSSFKLAIVVFEKKDVFGPGLPHSDEFVLPFHITNMCAKDMSIRSAVPGDFQDWVQNNRIALKALFPDIQIAFACPDCHPEQCRHYPRAVMGEYLKSRFEEAVQAARTLGVTVELKPNTEVTDLAEHGEGVRLTARGAAEPEAMIYDVNGVLLATGHWFGETEERNYFPSPWPASELLAAIPEGETIGVIGSSLSAIEVALTLTSDGRFVRRVSGELIFEPPTHPRKIVFYSRQGLLPRVRGRSGQRPNRFLTCNAIRRLIAANPGRLTLSAVFELLERELAVAYNARIDWSDMDSGQGTYADRLRQYIQKALDGDGADGELVWQTILVEIIPVARDLYLNLLLSERKRFDQYFNTRFFMHAATQPVVNAEKLLALMQAGMVSIVKLGNDYQFERNSTGLFHFCYRDSGGREHHASHRYIVNARGQPRSMESDRAALTRNLLGRGLVQIEESQPCGPESITDIKVCQEPASDRFSYKTGSLVVDPLTHKALRADSDGTTRSTLPIYAVGAMTRGQMIDASMAYGIARSTAAIADDLITAICKDGDF